VQLTAKVNQGRWFRK